MTTILQTARQQRFSLPGPAAVLLFGLLVATILTTPSFANPAGWAGTLGAFAPLALVAMASTPSIIAGGIDLSISPLMTLVNIVAVKVLLQHEGTSGVLLIPICIGIGAAVGVVVGAAVALLRLPPVLVTLAAMFVLTGVDLKIAPAAIATGSSWLDRLADTAPGALLIIGMPLMIWWWIARGPFGVAVRSVGSSDATAMSAGINVVVVRLLAYTGGGALAGLAGVSYTALTHSADAEFAQQYTILALAAVALGGIAFNGGQGSLSEAAIGAASLFLINNLLNAVGVSPSWLNIAYGAALLVAIIASRRGPDSSQRGIAV